eukprot:gene34701-biopygen35777
MHWAAWWGHAEVARQILHICGSRADCVCVLDGQDRPPVWYAAQWGHLEVMRVLIEAGADLSVVDESGASVAHLAAAGGFVEVLLELEMQVHVAIVLGAERDAVSMTMKIISADLSHADNDGNTPAHRAAMVGEADSLRVLHELGVDLSHADNEGRTPVYGAAAGGHVEALRVLQDAGADLSHADNDGSTPAHSAAGGGYVEVLRVLQDAGADLSHANKYGSTPVHRAAAGGYVEALRVLQDAGADLSHADNDGSTPAHSAAVWGYVEVLRVLQDAGADLSHADNDGRMLGLFRAARTAPLSFLGITAVKRHGETRPPGAF